MTFQRKAEKNFLLTKQASKSELMQRYNGDLSDAIGLISSRLPSNSVVLLRTTPLSRLSDGRQYALRAEFNAALRHVGNLKNIGVLDWEAMTRSQMERKPSG